MKLFISYSTDNLDLVKEIADALKGQVEVKYWEQDKEPGEDAWKTIFGWIDNSDLVVAVITDKTVSRAMSVGQEIGRAVAKHKTIIPTVSKGIPQTALGCIGGITKVTLEEDKPSDIVASIEKIVLSRKPAPGSECRKNAEFLTFRDGRLNQIRADNTPVPLDVKSRGILYLYPIAGYEDEAEGFKILFDNYQQLRPIAVGAWDGPKVDTSGFCIPSWLHQTGTCTSYVHAFKFGALEAVSTGIFNASEKRINSIAYEKRLIEALGGYLEFYKQVDIKPPVCLSLSFLEVKDFVLQVGRLYNAFNTVQPISENELIFQPITITDLGENPATILRPLFDQVWQACGFPYSWNYDEADNWSDQWNH